MHRAPRATRAPGPRGGETRVMPPCVDCRAACACFERVTAEPNPQAQRAAPHRWHRTRPAHAYASSQRATSPFRVAAPHAFDISTALSPHALVGPLALPLRCTHGPRLSQESHSQVSVMVRSQLRQARPVPLRRPSGTHEASRRSLKALMPSRASSERKSFSESGAVQSKASSRLI